MIEIAVYANYKTLFPINGYFQNVVADKYVTHSRAE